MNQPNNRRAQPPASGGTTRPNTRPNPALQPHKPINTYRARSTSGVHVVHSSGDILAQRATARVRTDRSRRRRRILFFFLALLLIVAGTGAWVLASIGTTVIPAISKVFRTPISVRPAPDGVTNATAVPVTFPDWGKKDPINILLIGLDYRPEEKDSRADTQIVVHIDPAAKTATLLSIPRDLWLKIPGYGEDRVNAAFQKGEDDQAKVPGGGPGLAMATIEQNFGIHIDYYAQVDFNGFEQIIDTIGGIVIDVPKPLADNEYPFNDYGYTRIYVQAGLQRMDGRTALEYARSRHADSDIGRNSRQQQVLLAVRQQGLNLNLITKMNQLSSQLSDAVQTDLSPLQVAQLAQLSKSIDAGSIQNVVIDSNVVTETILPNGADVLIPNWDLIRPKVAQAFADPKLSKEAARISVQNGTTTSGVGRKVYDILVPKGFFIPDLSSAPNQGTYPLTTIVDYTGGKKPLTIQALTKDLGLSISQVKSGNPQDAPLAANDNKPVDIVVIAGDDRIK